VTADRKAASNEGRATGPLAVRARTIGRRLRRLREEAGLSQRAIAQRGISAAYISRIEAGERMPSGQALRQLAARLGTTALVLEVGEANAARRKCPHCGRK
jgi:transcriptional regulator with XRE-family HTH domain